MSNSTKPSGAMSLLDKYASINSSIEDARRRAASARAIVDATNSKIHELREHRAEMVGQIRDANTEASKLKEALEKYTVVQREKIAEKNRVERENNMAKMAYTETQNLIDQERIAFLERCREFRAMCRKIRAAASILVLDGGGGCFDARRDAGDEVDLWRKLQDDDVSEDEGGEHKKIDPELDEAEKDEKKSRENHIEAECGLDTTRSEHENATKRSSARRAKLSQQRAQLERHRQEVEELEREIKTSKDAIVEANQLAKTFEEECRRRKQIRRTNVQASYSNNFNAAPQESRVSNPYRRNSQTKNNIAPVSNPYNRTPQHAPTNSTGTINNPYRPRNGNGGVSSSHRYASDLINEVTPHQYGNNRSAQQNKTLQRPSQHQQGGTRASRHNRQFGTNVGVSMDSEMTDELRECMTAFSTDNNISNNRNSDDLSVSSNCSSDDEILSFNIFGKK